MNTKELNKDSALTSAYVSNQSNESNARPLGVNQMHVRTGSSKLNPMAKKTEDKSRSASSMEAYKADGGQIGADLGKAATVSKTFAAPQRKKAKDISTDGRNAVTQLQSQEKKAGDRQSVPNIEESITVKLGNQTPMKEEDLIAQSLDNQSIIIVTDEELQKRNNEEQLTNTNKTQRRDSVMDASKEVRNLLEFLFLDVKVRSPAEIQELTDQKLVQERTDLALVPTPQLIKDIRASIEILLSIKNDQVNTNNGGQMDTLMMQEDSMADRTSLSDHPFHSHSPRSTNPFDKANKNRLLSSKEGPGRPQDNASIKSQSLFSNYYSNKNKKAGGATMLAGERALTEFGSNFEPRRDSIMSDMSMNTQQNCVALEQQLQKYEGDIRKHISIEHQLQLFAEDLKRSVTQLEKDKELLESQKDQQLEELKKDKMTLREFLDIKEKTIEENNLKIKELEEQAAEVKVQMAHQKQKYDKQLADLKSKINILQAAVDSKNAVARLENGSKLSYSNEKPTRHQFQKLSSDNNSSQSQIGTTVTGSVKANSRSINSMSRTMSKQQISHQQINNASNRNSGSQILFTNSQHKTPVGAQLSTGVTTGSQKHLHLNSQQQSSQQSAVVEAKISNRASGAGTIPKQESQQIQATQSQQHFGLQRKSMGQSQNQAQLQGANQGGTSNQNVISKVRKTPSEFQLTSFLVVQNNLTQAIHQNGNQHDSGPQNAVAKSRQGPNGAKSITQGISPIKSSRKVAGSGGQNGLNQAPNSSVQQVVQQMNSKHTRSSAQLDVAKISLTSRVGPNDSPIIKRTQHQQSVAQMAKTSLSNGETAAIDAYKKSLPSKQTVKDIRKQQISTSNNHGTAASAGRRSGASSVADASNLNMSSNNGTGHAVVEDGTHSPMQPNSAPETAVDMSARRQNSKKQQALKEYDQYSKNAGTQPQPNRQQQTLATSNGQKVQQSTNKSYAMPTHRRSNTAASFVPQMTLKQFQEQKNAALANSQVQRQKINKSQVNSFDMRASTGPIEHKIGTLSAQGEVTAASARVPGTMASTERSRQQVSSQMHPSKSNNLATVKKFDVIRRDKSQPEVLFRGEKRQVIASGTANQTQNVQQHLAVSQKPQTKSTSQNTQRTLNSTVMISGNPNTNVIQGTQGKSATQGRLSNSVMHTGPSIGHSQPQKSNQANSQTRKQAQQMGGPPYFVQGQRGSLQNNGQFKQAAQTSQMHEGSSGPHAMQQQISKNVAQKQQKLLRNQIFKSSDYTKVSSSFAQPSNNSQL